MREYFSKAVAFLRSWWAGSWFAFKLNQLRTKLPYRMALGKFGIGLMKVGRALQVRYANWNSEFRLEHEFDCSNTNRCDLHVSEMVISDSIFTFNSKDSQKDKQPPLVIDIFLVRGVSKVILYPYRIEITKGAVFDWRELLPEIEKILLKHLTAKAEDKEEATNGNGK